MGATLMLSFLGILAIGVPVAFALGIAAVVVFVMINPSLLALLPQRIFTGIDLFALVAVPLFILAGELMGGSGILDRITAFSKMVAGGIRGSLAQVTILVSMIFGWINGSGVAGASAVGSLMIPSMAAKYKNPGFACAVTACSSTVGPVIPPSVPMIIYALVAQNVSVGALFAAGVVPGILMGVGMMVVAYWIARRRNYPTDKAMYTLVERLVTLRKFIVALLLPVIMVGGIISGAFTPVESGAIAVLYALLVGFFLTRSLTLKTLYDALRRTGIISSVVFLMMGVANVASWIMTTEQVPQGVAAAVKALTDDPLMFLLLINLILLVVGCLFDVVAAMVMFGPILIPMAEAYGIDPLHFGMVVCVNLIVGLVTPPVGICLFIVSGLSGTPIEKVVKESLPFLAWLLVVLVIVTYWPESYMWLPDMLGYH